MKTFLIIAFTLISLNIFATSQFPDRIIYKGEKYALNCNPLEDFFNNNLGKRPNKGSFCTGLLRGYVGTFEISDNQLLLKDIEIIVPDTLNKKTDVKSVSVIKEIFPTQDIINVDWFSGLLVIPYGKVVNYVHMGYASTYENYYLLEINKGKLIKERKLNSKQYDQFRENQFQAFKKTNEYKKQKEELQKSKKYSDDFIDSFLKSFFIQYTTKILPE